MASYLHGAPRRDPEAVRSGAASVRLSLRKHVRLGKTDPEEVVSLGDPVTLDLSSSEPQQVGDNTPGTARVVQ